MTAQQTGWQELPPGFSVDPQIAERVSLRLDHELLQTALGCHGLDRQDMDDLPIRVRSEPVRDVGSFTVHRLTWSSGEVSDMRSIQLFAAPIFKCSDVGLYLHSLKHEEREDKKDVLRSANFSSVLIHELGHLAAYENKPIPQLTRFKYAGRRQAFWQADMRKRSEEAWVLMRTRDILTRHPDLLRLIAADSIN